MDSFVIWLGATPVSLAFKAQVSWLWPICETLHFVGLALLMGVIGLFDLRLLGVIRRVSVSAVADLLPWAMVGFVLNLITGLFFVISEPMQYAGSGAWWAKVFFLGVAGLNVIAFEKLLRGKAHAVQLGEDTPPSLKLSGAVSLIAWSGVLFFGRMMPYIAAPQDAGF